jgi:hypothetical protein
VKPRKRAAPAAPGGSHAWPRAAAATQAAAPAGAVAKISHTLPRALALRLEEFAFFQRVSQSAVIEYSLAAFFARNRDDAALGEELRRTGAGRRRKL